jgi:uncharacterized protein (TIGR02996 family)
MAGDELLARIASNPEDDGAYLVYADFLTSKGDPHGELIVLQHQLEHEQDDERRAYLGNALDAYQTKHRKKLFGELGGHQGIWWDFHCGFLRAVHVLPDINDKLPAVMKQILELPIARFVRELHVFDRWPREHEAIKRAVEQHKPATLPGVVLVKRHEVLDEAVAAGDDVQWLALRTDEEREPAAIAKLANLEWLEIGGGVPALSADLAKLTKLRRLDVDWSGVRRIADEVFGIEALSYLSMYDCQLPKTYHMGRMNSLLFGFSRARTPSRRRIIELNLLLGNDAKAKKLATRSDLLAALDNNVAAVREGALRLIGEKLPDPFANGPGTSFALLGKTNLDKKEIAAHLKTRAIELTQKITGDTTHVILGLEPAGKQAAIGELPIVLDSHLQALFAAKQGKPAKGTGAIAEGLRSGDEKATANAVAAITAFDRALLVDLVVVLSDTKLGKSREAAKKLVALHAPEVKAAFDAHLKSSVLNEAMGETKRAERIAAFAKQAKLDGLELAMRLVERAQVGLLTAMAHGSAATLRALEAMAAKEGGKKLDLSGKELDAVPPEIARLAKVADVNLCANHFTKFPEPVLAMKSLVRLDVSGNRIGKIPDAIAKTKLVHLDISSNRWRRFPMAVLDIPTLEELDVSNSQEYVENEARITGIPDEIGKLAKLKRFSYCYNILERFPDAFWSLPIEELDIGFCTLPDEIPPQLGKLKKLKKLTVHYSGWANRKPQLKKLLPKCEIKA